MNTHLFMHFTNYYTHRQCAAAKPKGWGRKGGEENSKIYTLTREADCPTG